MTDRDDVERCIKALDEAMDILTEIELDLADSKEDELVPDMQLHELYDMSEDVSESSRIRRAETTLARRQNQDPADPIS